MLLIVGVLFSSVLMATLSVAAPQLLVIVTVYRPFSDMETVGVSAPVDHRI